MMEQLELLLIRLQHFQPEQLQFLRPLWFLAFIPLLLLMILIWRRRLVSKSWQAVCDAQLLPHVLTHTQHRSSRLPLITAAIAGSLCIIAAAGPVLEKIPQPIFREQSALVILLDLSQSMNATDLKPSRLERAKLKLLDLLKTRKAGQTALLVYAADTFVVTPLTDDTNTISNLVPTLETSLMPSQGSHAYIALNQSAELLRQAGITQGHILLMTDGLQQRDLDVIDSLAAASHSVSVMGIGTADGSPIPVEGGFLQNRSGSIVVPKLETHSLQQAARQGKGIYVSLQADDSDLDRLIPVFNTRRVAPETPAIELNTLELTADSWQEEGPWLLLLVIPLAALWPRRGWLLCLPLLILPLPEPAMAVEAQTILSAQLSLDHLWTRADQKAMKKFNQGDNQNAAAQFEDPRWKASAHYRAGDYEAALNTLGEAQSSDDHYNRGNILSHLGRYPEAIEAYDSALELDSENEDAAYNREQVKQLLEEQQQESQQQDPNQEQQDSQQQQDKQQGESSDEQQSEHGEPSSSENNDSQDEQNTENPSQQDSAENQTAEQQDKQQSQSENSQQEKNQAEQNQADQNQQDESDEEETPPEDQEVNASEVDQAIEDAQQREQLAQKEQRSEADEKDNETEESQQIYSMEEPEQAEHDPATEQWLRRIPDDPGLLLKRKFYYQYQREADQVVSEQPW